MEMKSLFRRALLAACLLSGPGCFWVTTKSEGDTLRKNIQELDGRVATKEKQFDSKVSELQAVLDDATRLLKRNSADLGADVDQLRNDVRVANGLVAAINNQMAELKAALEATKKDSNDRITALEQRLGSVESGKPTANSSPDDLWRLGSTAFEAQRFSEALELFKRLLQAAPTHERSDDAQYFRGQSYTNLKEWDSAIREYQRLYDKYPTSPLADDGLYFAALAAESLKNCSEARTYLGLIKQKFPKSNVLKIGGDADKRIKAALKNKEKCSS
ncbi:MAG: tetratricopeptide repeat protein [Myxococcales bacterium]|nr:tetratricopeptide repeat protein [Myxococcales bacterium]